MITSRTDPWKWYCRIDGQEGEYQTPEERDAAAIRHRDKECVTRDRLHIGHAEVGRLLHVWRY